MENFEVLERATADPKLGLLELGTLLKLSCSGPVETGEAHAAYTEERLDLLVEAGYLQKNFHGYTLAGVEYDDAEIKAYWQRFYKKYPGVKGGNNVALAQLKRKFAKKWRGIVMILPEQLERQMQEREIMSNAIALAEQKGNKRHGLFVPGWKNLSTYINQQGWTDIYQTPAELLPPSEVTPFDENTADRRYLAYWKFAMDEGMPIMRNAVAVQAAMLSEEEFIGIIEERAGAFKNFSVYITLSSLKIELAKWQKEYFSSVMYRQQYGRLIDFCNDRFRQQYKQTA